MTICDYTRLPCWIHCHHWAWHQSFDPKCWKRRPPENGSKPCDEAGVLFGGKRWPLTWRNLISKLETNNILRHVFPTGCCYMLFFFVRQSWNDIVDWNTSWVVASVFKSTAAEASTVPWVTWELCPNHPCEGLPGEFEGTCFESLQLEVSNLQKQKTAKMCESSLVRMQIPGSVLVTICFSKIEIKPFCKTNYIIIMI